MFVAVNTDIRFGNYWDHAGYQPAPSATARMALGANWPGNGAWDLNPSQQICVPGTTTPRNLYYPNGFLWPMHLDAQGRLTAPNRFVVMNGSDLNEYLTGSLAGGGLSHPDGGRPVVADIYSIDQPELRTSPWVTGILPPMNNPRVYSNVVLLPDEQLFVVGGATYDHLPFKGQTSAFAFQNERIADPVFEPEMIELDAPSNGWKRCPPHVSPRLYHSVALLLPDARVLVAGGYRGVVPMTDNRQNWTPENKTWGDFFHSNIEIFSPDYLLLAPRPQILQIVGGNSIGYTQGGSGNKFQVRVALPGAANPNSAIGSVCLVNPGSVTHHYDWDQRFVGLHFTVVPNTDRIEVTPPADAAIAPPGWYMLFVVSSPAATNGVKVPSVAAFVHLQ